MELCQPVPQLSLPDILLVVEETGQWGSVGLLAGAGSRLGMTCLFAKEQVHVLLLKEFETCKGILDQTLNLPEPSGQCGIPDSRCHQGSTISNNPSTTESIRPINMDYYIHLSIK